MKSNKVYKRVFLGEIDVYNVVIEGEEQSDIEQVKMKRRFHKAHLSAYLKGHERFHFGRDIENKWVWYDVMIKDWYEE